MKFLVCIDGDVSRGEDSQAPERDVGESLGPFISKRKLSLQSAGTPTYLKVRSHAVVIAGLGC